MNISHMCSNKMCTGRAIVSFLKYENYLKKNVINLSQDPTYYICKDGKSPSFLSSSAGIHCPYCGHYWDYQVRNEKDKKDCKSLKEVLIDEYILSKHSVFYELIGCFSDCKEG